jgi:5-methylcytosine-specific restriction endonuclease McrA
MAPGACIVLNNSYAFLSINNWFEAMRLVVRGRAVPLANYETKIRAEREEFDAPAVVMLKHHVNLGRRRQPFTLPSHRNIWVRDGGHCAYCNHPLTLRTVTKEHVMPRSRGGEDSLLNVVSACGDCNAKKSNRTPAEAGMKFRDGIELRHLNDEEKLTVLLKTSQSHERKTWLGFLKKQGLTLF